MQHMKRYETDDLSVTTTTNHYRKRKKNEADRQF